MCIDIVELSKKRGSDEESKKWKSSYLVEWINVC